MHYYLATYIECLVTLGFVVIVYLLVLRQQYSGWYAWDSIGGPHWVMLCQWGGSKCFEVLLEDQICCSEHLILFFNILRLYWLAGVADYHSWDHCLKRNYPVPSITHHYLQRMWPSWVVHRRQEFWLGLAESTSSPVQLVVWFLVHRPICGSMLVVPFTIKTFIALSIIV